MLPDRVSNPGPLTYESGALPIALRGPAKLSVHVLMFHDPLWKSFIYQTANQMSIPADFDA